MAVTDIATENILLSQGNGGFNTPTGFFVGGNPVALAIGDFNSDGFPDLVVASYQADKVTLLMNTGRLYWKLFHRDDCLGPRRTRGNCRR
jgi:hypothetical protein